MKHSRRWATLPIAMVMLAPAAASAADLDVSGINKYSSNEQVTSINQFSDVKPTDWAYQALSNLIERYGCVAGYPNGTFKGGQALTRYEAAALLSACLDRITEVTDELRRLLNEFDKELALLKGRVDGLESRVGKLEASQFSTTTRLRADTRWVLGGLNYTGNAIKDGRWGDFAVNNKGVRIFTPRTDLREALTFNYDVRLNFDTSFTGKDLLRTQLRSGNFRDSGFGADPTRLSQLEAQFQEDLGNGSVDSGDVVAINRLFYKFPVGKTFTATIGPRFAIEEGLPVGLPTVYKSDQILRIFQHAGAPGAYNRLLGSGAGLFWKQPGKSGFSFGGSYVSANADNGQPNGNGGRGYGLTGPAANPIITSSGGIGNAASQQAGTLQLAYTGKNWNITGAYTYNSAGVPIIGTPLSTALLPSIYNNIGGGRVNSWSIAGYWQPLTAGWLPSVSAGWGYNNYVYNGSVADTVATPLLAIDSAKSQSWYVGLNWKDVFVKGNALGFAVGQPTFITSISGSSPAVANKTYDGNYAAEVFYKFQVTDHIAVTPALFWLTRGRGEQTGAALNTALAHPSSGADYGLGTFGGLIQTTFRF